MANMQAKLFDLSLLFTLIFTQIQRSSAQTTTANPAYGTATPTPTASSTYNVFSAIASSHPGDGGTGPQPGNVASDPTTQAGQNAAGASGSDSGSMNLSTGATIAIAVIVSVVVLLGAASAVLFYLAKKRQWQVRASLRRMTGLGRPKTPRTGASSTARKGRSIIRIEPPTGRARDHRVEEEKTPIMEGTEYRSDVEKGLRNKTVVQVAPTGQSSFDMDSPRNVQSAKWSKVFVKREQ